MYWHNKSVLKSVLLPAVLLGAILFVGSGFFSVGSLAASVPESLKTIDIVYYMNFPWREKYETQAVKGCRRSCLPLSGTALRCEENVSLLRPLHIIKLWQKQQREMGFFTLTMDEFGIKNVHGYIKKIKSVPFDLFSAPGQKTKTGTVTGRFVRHVTDVRKYQFKNMATGRISSIYSTPKHPFYVKNRGIFVPVEEISPTDQMIQKDGQIVRIIHPVPHCRCVRPLTGESIAPVYNLEILQKHTYFVGRDFILVHNPCERPPKKNGKIPLGDRFQRMWDNGFIGSMPDLEDSSKITLSFQLKWHERERFHLSCGYSKAKNRVNARRADIFRPLTRMGFVAMDHLGSSGDGERVIFWVLTDVARFREELYEDGATSSAYSEALSLLGFLNFSLPYDLPLPLPPPLRLPLPSFSRPQPLTEPSLSSMPGSKK